jgi:hypothetical protein
LKTFAVTATAIGKIPRGLFNRLYQAAMFGERGGSASIPAEQDLFFCASD